MDGYYGSRRVFTPFGVRVFFWIQVWGCVIAGLVMFFIGLSDPYFRGDFVWKGLLLFLIGPLVARFEYEVLMTVLRIDDALSELEDGLLEKRKTLKWDKLASDLGKERGGRP